MNKIHTFNILELYEELQVKSMTQVADEKGCFRGSIDWIVKTQFPLEWRHNIKYERVPHKNIRRKV